MTFSGTAYCQVSDVITAVTSFNFGGTPGDINPAIVQAAVDQATAKVSAWTGINWAVDSQGTAITVPDIIQSITINIATYYATLSYRKNKPMDANDPVLLRYNDACADLQAIQEGKITPDPVASGAPLHAGGGRVINTQLRTFTLENSGTCVERGHIEPQTYPGGYNGAIPPWW